MTTAILRNPLNIPILIAFIKDGAQQYEREKGVPFPRVYHAVCYETPDSSDKCQLIYAVLVTYDECAANQYRIIGRGHLPKFEGVQPEVIEAMAFTMPKAKDGEQTYQLEDYDEFFKTQS